MKKLIQHTLLLVLFSSFTFLKSDCGTLIFFKENTIITMVSYDDEGKTTGSTKTTFTKVTKTSTGLSVNASQQNFNKKGKLNSTSEFLIVCNNGNLHFDMKMMLPQEQADTYKDFEMSVEGADKEIPADLVVGKTLKDALVKVTFKTKSGTEMPMMKMNLNITNRKVEAKENITTPAGTFECYKISEDVEVKSIITMKLKAISWFSKEVGIVKTESYKSNGKYVNKTELTEISK